jgi:hypothetical protein
MRLLGRLVLGALALALALPCGVLALAIGVLADPGLSAVAAVLGVAGLEAVFDAMGSGLPDATGLALASMAAWALFILVALPPTLAALVGEVFRLGRLAWYGGASGALSAALPWVLRPGVPRISGAPPAALVAEGRVTALLFVTGAVSGLVYWMVAGRSAGARRAPAPYSPSP